MLLAPLCLLIAMSPIGGDEPTLSWESDFATLVSTRAEQSDMCSGGSSAFAVGESTIGFGLGEETSTFVRSWDRSTGAELWKREWAEERALGVTCSPDGSVVYALIGVEAMGVTDGVERMLVLSGITGQTLFESETILPAALPFSRSVLDALVLSPSGLTLYRLDFSRFGGTLRVKALNTQTGDERWNVVRDGFDIFEPTPSAEQGVSLAVAADSLSVYLTLDAPSAGNNHDVEIVRLSAVDGSEYWSVVAGATGLTNRAVPPMPAPDGSGVFILRWTLGFAPVTTVEKRSSVDGSVVGQTTLTLVYPRVATFNASTMQLGVAASAGFSSAPDGTELAVEAVDLATLTSQWFTTYSGPIFSDDPLQMSFSDAGDLMNVVTAQRNPSTFQPVGYQVRGINPTSGASEFLADLANIGSALDLHEAWWLDAPAIGGSTSLVATGFSAVDADSGVTRTAFDPVTGVEVWSETTDDELPGFGSPVGRVWLAHDGASVWSAPTVMNQAYQVLRLRLVQRSTTDGQLLQSIEIPNDGASSSVFSVSFSPFAPLAIVEAPVTQSFSKRFVVLDLTGGSAGFELALPTATTYRTFSFEWSPDGTRVYALSKMNSASVFAIDLAGQAFAWGQPSMINPLPFGSAIPLGLAVDAQTNDVFVAVNLTSTFPVSDSLVKRRYSGLDGATLWTESVPADLLSLGAFDFQATVGENVTRLFGSRRPLLTSAPDGSKLTSVVIASDGIDRRLLIAGVNPDLGGTTWTRLSTLFLGTDMRVIDVAQSEDGGRLFALAQGSEVGGTGEQHGLLMAVDLETVTVLWDRLLDEPFDLARGVKSIGEGDRVAVTYSDRANAESNGVTETVVFDSLTGIELWRSEAGASDTEVCDLAVGTDGSLYTVGQKDVAGHSVGFVRREQATRLADGNEAISVANGGSYPLHLDFGLEHANHVYLIAASSTGSAPGTPFGGLLIPLALDPFTLTSINSANQGAFQNTLGVTDSKGDARAEIQVPSGQLTANLAGLTLYYAAILYDPQLGMFVETTQAVSTTLVP